MKEIVVDKKVIRAGGSLGFRLTKELKMLDAEVGDILTVCITKRPIGGATND